MRSQGKIFAPKIERQVNTETQPTRAETLSRILHGNLYQGRKTQNVIGELLEPQSGQVWDLKTAGTLEGPRHGGVGVMAHFCEFYF